MPRKKLALAYITNGGARTAALKKRLPGLLKKAQELAVLCDVPGCAVLYAPGESAPVVWPSPEVAMSLLRKINSNSTEEGSFLQIKANNVMNREKLRLKRLEKARAGYSRVIAQNTHLSGELVLRGIVSGRRPLSNHDFHELHSVSGAIARRAQAVETCIIRRKMLDFSGHEQGALHTSPPALTLTPSVQETVGFDGVGEYSGPEIYSVGRPDDFDPAEWDAFNTCSDEMEWNPLFSPPTVDAAADINNVVFNHSTTEIHHEPALQQHPYQWCWTGSDGGGDAAPAAYDFTDIRGDGTSAEMLNTSSESDIEEALQQQHQWCWTGSEGGGDLTDIGGGDGTSTDMLNASSDSEIEEALQQQHQWCWAGSEGGGDLTVIGGGDGTSGDMFTSSESEQELETCYNK
ncbi:MADS-box transcription factor 20 [Platanthera zijinensis]|uniref:MADS-box transcription factor 20 n=1 Tax=Platanthera zijinensis TaxID=2320716 RepID=A0AAP0BRA8_9ASPA